MTDNYPNNIMRVQMRMLENIVKKQDDEVLVYLVEYIASELEKRSQQYMEECYKANKKAKRKAKV